MTTERLEKMVAALAAWYEKRCPSIDADDLRQVGRMAVQDAAKRVDASNPKRARAFYRQAAVLSMRRYVWTSISPVSGGSNVTASVDGFVADLRMQYR